MIRRYRGQGPQRNGEGDEASEGGGDGVGDIWHWTVEEMGLVCAPTLHDHTIHTRHAQQHKGSLDLLDNRGALADCKAGTLHEQNTNKIIGLLF